MLAGGFQEGVQQWGGWAGAKAYLALSDRGGYLSGTRADLTNLDYAAGLDHCLLDLHLRQPPPHRQCYKASVSV